MGPRNLLPQLDIEGSQDRDSEYALRLRSDPDIGGGDEELDLEISGTAYKSGATQTITITATDSTATYVSELASRSTTQGGKAMPLEIFKQAREEDLHSLDLCHQAGLEVAAENSDSESVEKLTFWFRRMTAGEMNKLSDNFISTNRRGRSSYKLGDNARSKFVKSYHHHDGEINFEGSPAERITGEIYDTLPAWLSERSLSFINDLNGLDEDDESD